MSFTELLDKMLKNFVFQKDNEETSQSQTSDSDFPQDDSLNESTEGSKPEPNHSKQ